jgi:CHAT domain-containing protein
MARLERDRDNLDAARGRIEEALAAIESLRLSVKSHHLRASFLASMKKYYELDIEVLMRLHAKRPAEGFAAAALHASEKGRARSLLELLTEAGAEIRRDVEPALLERESVLRQLILDQAAEQQSRGFGSRTQDEQAAVAREIDNLTTEYEQLQARIRQSSPRYGALTQPVPLTLKEIQTQVLDDETLLLEYALGEKQSYLWAVSPNSIRSFELPGRQTVESAARRVYENITARKQHVSSESPEQRRTRLQQADAEFPAASEELSRMLLGPVAAELKNKRLLIVADGMLQYLPFAALPDPSASQPVAANSTPVKTAAGAPASFYDRPPLIVAHEVISLPSASVLAVLRREAQGRKPAEKTVAVFADPVFNNTDPRVGAKGKEGSPAAKETAVSRDISRAAAESGLEDLARLRFSRLEAEQIMRMVPEGKSFGAVDFAANRSAATSGDLRNYAILHFATHGLINNQHPELSGIVLSLVDERGQPQDGFLRLFNIYNLKLDAELVVLSACQTALGKEVKGEGLVSLTRGFMYAGAPRVVATLWPIYDRATADFMGRFYEAMLRQKVRPAAALRQAQVSMWKDKRWQAPYYWAGFALQGEWK